MTKFLKKLFTNSEKFLFQSPFKIVNVWAKIAFAINLMSHCISYYQLYISELKVMVWLYKENKKAIKVHASRSFVQRTTNEAKRSE